jgi:glycosyltransferase involved in cell wall biosynthesis
MNFLYDLSATQPSPQSKFHGGGEYGEVLFFKLLEYTEKINMTAYYDSSVYINPDIIKAAEEKNVKLFDIKKQSLSEIITSQKIDRAYSAMLNLNQNWPLGNIDIFTTVHGLRTLEMPVDKIMLQYDTNPKDKLRDFLFLTLLNKWYIKKLKTINGRLVTDSRINVITISKHSKASINSFYPETQNRNIPVFASPTFDQLDNYKSVKTILNDSNLNEYGIEKGKFFLITSAARWNKNALRAILAFDQLVSDGNLKGFKLVVTGVTNKKIFEKHIKNSKNVKLLSYVERDELELLNRTAYAFIYPSLNEGFGYPPIDSMKYGVPVIASGTTSIPEVCGDAALYFDPYSISEIKNRIVQITDADIYKEMQDKAMIRYNFIAEKQNQDLKSLAEYIIK